MVFSQLTEYLMWLQIFFCLLGEKDGDKPQLYA